MKRARAGLQVAQLRLVAGEAEQAAADSAQALKAEARANHRDLALARQEIASCTSRIQVLRGIRGCNPPWALSAQIPLLDAQHVHRTSASSEVMDTDRRCQGMTPLTGTWLVCTRVPHLLHSGA